MHYGILFLSAILGCFSLQMFAFHAAGGRTTKSESNYHSSIARIQHGIRIHPDILLLGSSRTARMDGGRSSGLVVANMGCDGGSAAIALRAIDQNLIPSAGTIIIEGNTLLHDMERRGWQIEQAMHSVWFKIGSRFPLLSSCARPSAFLYSVLLEFRTGVQKSDNTSLLPVSTHAKVNQNAQPLTGPANELVDELSAILDRLRLRDTRLLLVILPPGASENSLNTQIPRELSRRTNTPLLDLTAGLPENAVRLTDGVHMSAESAAAALRTILAAAKVN